MLKKIQNFIGTDDEDLSLRLFLCAFGIAVGVPIVLLSQAFEPGSAISIALISLGCAITGIFICAAGIDYVVKV